MAAEEEPAARESAAPGWSKAENWAWGRIRAGEVADFAEKHGALDPGKEKGWGDDRTLGPDFLRAILFRKEYIDQIPIEGVRISGARWTDALSLPHAEVKYPLCLEACRFEGPVDLAGLRLDARLSLRNSFFKGAGRARSLTLEGAKIARADLSGTVFGTGIAGKSATFDGLLDLSGAAVDKLDLERAKLGCLQLCNGSAQSVELSEAEVDQDVDLSGARVEGPVSMSGMQVGQDLSLRASAKRRAVFSKEINVEGGFVGGHVSFLGADAKGPVRMNALEIRKNLYLRSPLPGEEKTFKGKTVFGDTLDLNNAVIGGYVEFLGARFRGPVEMQGTQIGENLSAWGTESQPTIFHGPVRIILARIKGVADFTGAHFQDDVDFTAASVEGNLDLSGATIFDKILNMGDARIGRHFFMKDLNAQRARCKGPVRLENMMVAGSMELDCLCEGPLSCFGVKVGLRLFLSATSGGHFKGMVDFSHAEIKGLASFDSGKFEGGLNLQSIEVGQDLLLRAAIGGPIIISNASVGGSLGLSTTTEYRIDLRGLRVGQDLILDGTFGPPDQSVRDRIDADRPTSPDPAIFTAGEADLRDLRIGRDLFVSGTYWDPVNLSQSRIERLLVTVGADFKQGLDLSASVIEGQLQIRLPPRQAETAPSPLVRRVQLDLRDVKAASLQVQAEQAHLDDEASWPEKGSVQLDGFIYERLGGSGVDPAAEMVERPIEWHERWLELDQPYSPQPYEHLSAIFAKAGQTGKANAILYRGRERARKAAWQSGAWGRGFGLEILKWTIGYGIGYGFFWAMLSAALLTGVGVAWLGTGPVGAGGKFVLETWAQKFAYSFDQMLPIIELNNNFGDVTLPLSAEYYFYVHKLLGFLLGSFIAAGIAGLTQRSKS